MRRFIAVGAVLAACLTALPGTPAGAQDQEFQAVFTQLGRGVPPVKQAKATETQTKAGDIQLASCDTCGPVDLDFGPVGGGCGGQFYVGAEYLYVRPTFSQAISFITQDISDPANPVITYNNFDFGHESNFRVYGGYRVCECACDVRFTYTSMSGDSAFQTPTVNVANGLTFFSPLEVFADLDGTSISGSASVDLDTFDLDFAKTIPLGSVLGCNTGCSDPCACWCPAWDVTWHGGFRAIDYESNFVYDDFRTTAQGGDNADQTSVARTTFSGAGLRTGMTGRRYFGKSGFASVFLRGDISLLLGDLDIVAFSADGNRFSEHRISNTQIIPVTEIEAGGTLLLTRNLTLSAGYLLAAYHDLGYRVEYPFSSTSTGSQIDNFDDANILGWDGFFLRAEATF